MDIPENFSYFGIRIFRMFYHKGDIFMLSYVFNFTLNDLTLTEIGNQKCTPLYSFGPFIRNEYIFHYVISGKGYCSIGNDSLDSSAKKPTQPFASSPTYEIKAGQGFLIEPHTKHIYNADLNDPWHYMWVVFKGAAAPRLLRACGFSKDNIVYQPKDTTIQTSQSIRQPLNNILEHPDGSESFIMGNFYLFMDQLASHAKNPILTEPNKGFFREHYINLACQYIALHYSSIRSLDEVAAYCNISQSHLTRLFREGLHMSLQEYLITTRLNHARELLITTHQSISEISWAVGYPNELNLLRAFKSHYGISPKEFRQKNCF